MKIILVPVDFSAQSETAVAYGAALARRLGWSLQLVHVVYIPLLYPDTFIATEPLLSTAQASEKLESLRAKYAGDLDCTITTLPGMSIREIAELVSARAVGLTVIATHGAATVTDEIVGTHTSELLGVMHAPLLVLTPEHAPPVFRRIVLTTDGFPPSRPELFQWLNTFSDSQTHVYVLHVHPTLEDIPNNIKEQISAVINQLPYSYHIERDSDVAAGVSVFVKKIDADLVVTQPRKHSFWHWLFHHNVSKQLVMYLPVPVLALPE
jgi:nucleotide-binding universal stress UspA family protein